MSNGATTPQDDAGLIAEAEKQYGVERLLVAANLLRQVQDKSLLQKEHHSMIRWADATEEGMKDLLQPPTNADSSWKKQSESHGNRDFFVYYQVSETNKLYCRIDSVIESSLLVPILSVFNESDLYSTWMPSWKKPFKLGVEETKKLKESGRGNQIIQVVVNMAYPFSTREVIQHAIAVDVIDEEGAIAIHVVSETHEDDPVIPEVPPRVVRIDFDASILIRGCPADHPLLAKSKNKYPDGEALILMSLKNSVDAHVSGVPVSLINFVTRTVLSALWSSLLRVSEEVRDGKRPLHQEAISGKRDLYDWVESRIDVMIEKVKNDANSKTEQAEATATTKSTEAETEAATIRTDEDSKEEED